MSKEIKYKHLIPAVLTGMVLFDAYTASAQEPIPDKCDLTVWGGIVTDYVSNWGDHLAGKSVQVQALLKCADGIHADIWGSKALENTNDGLKTDEVDVTLGYEKPVLGGVIADFGASLYYLNDDMEGDRNDYKIFRPYASIYKPFNHKAGITTPSVTIEGEIYADESAFPNSYYATAGVAHEFPKVLKTTLELKGDVYTNKGRPGGEGYKFGAAAKWNLNNQDILSAGVMTYIPTSASGKKITVGGLRLTRNF